jgi:hypothetical protein
MTMRLQIINDDGTRTAQVDIIDISIDVNDPEKRTACVTRQDSIPPKSYKEFYIYDTRYISVKEV